MNVCHQIYITLAVVMKKNQEDKLDFEPVFSQNCWIKAMGPFYRICLKTADRTEMSWFDIHVGRCSLGETCDVMMDKSKYFHQFVKFRVGNVIFLYNINQYENLQKDSLKFHIWPPC